MSLLLLDGLFHFLHIMLMSFVLFGWISKRARKLHFLSILIIFTSWFGLAHYFGYQFGYCFLTDWHWQIKQARGITDLPYSYLDHLIEVLGFEANSDLNDKVILVLTSLAFVLSVIFNLFDLKKRKPREQTNT